MTSFDDIIEIFLQNCAFGELCHVNILLRINKGFYTRLMTSDIWVYIASSLSCPACFLEAKAAISDYSTTNPAKYWHGICKEFSSSSEIRRQWGMLYSVRRLVPNHDGRRYLDKKDSSTLTVSDSEIYDSDVGHTNRVYKENNNKDRMIIKAFIKMESSILLSDNYHNKHFHHISQYPTEWTHLLQQNNKCINHKSVSLLTNSNNAQFKIQHVDIISLFLTKKSTGTSVSDTNNASSNCYYSLCEWENVDASSNSNSDSSDVVDRYASAPITASSMVSAVVTSVMAVYRSTARYLQWRERLHADEAADAICTKGTTVKFDWLLNQLLDSVDGHRTPITTTSTKKRHYLCDIRYIKRKDTYVTSLKVHTRKILITMNFNDEENAVTICGLSSPKEFSSSNAFLEYLALSPL